VILSDSNSVKDDGLGGALALSGDGTLAILGAPGVNSSTGAVDVFHSAGAWSSTSTPTATLTVTGGATGDGFGANLAVSSDGTTALVLAPNANAARGAAYIYHALSEGVWTLSATPLATLTNSGAHPKDTLGIGVLSADGATALVGAPGVRMGTGSAYVFHVLTSSAWLANATPKATLTDDALAACVVPKLKGLRLSAAKSALADERCKLGKVKRVHSTHKKGRVLSQSRKAGTRLAINAKVNVRVGK
jgi:hypothetical protein